MPRHDFPRPRLRRDVGGESFTPGMGWRAWVEERRFRRRRKPKPGEDGGVPVEPDKPRNLSGGAAAALEFDEE